MKKGLFVLFFIAIMFSCKQKAKMVIPEWVPYDESEEVAENATHESLKMRYKRIQSQILDKNDLWKNVARQLNNFGEQDYHKLTPYVLEQNIPTIQSNIEVGHLTYETLTQWYLYRIVKYENDRDKMLNALIAINSNAVNEARERDRNKSNKEHPIYGMPILNVDQCNNILIFNYDLQPGYSGVENPLYSRKNGITIIQGDASVTLAEVLKQLH